MAFILFIKSILHLKMRFHPSLLFPHSLPSEERHWSLVAQQRARCSVWWVTFLPLTAGQGHLELFLGKYLGHSLLLPIWGLAGVVIIFSPQGRKGSFSLQYCNLLLRLAAGCVPCPSLLLQYLCHILSLKNVKSLPPPYYFCCIFKKKIGSHIAQAVSNLLCSRG